MNIDDSLKIGDLLMVDSVKAIIFKDIHHQIIDLMLDSKEYKESIKLYFEQTTLKDMLSENLNQCPSIDTDEQMRFFQQAVSVYQYAIKFYQNNEILSPLLSSIHRNWNLVALNETYKAMGILQDIHAHQFAYALHEHFSPHEIKRAIKAKAKKAAIIRHENQRQAEKPIVDEITRLWDVECAKNPSKKLKQTDGTNIIHKILNKNEPLKHLYRELSDKDEVGYEKVKSVISEHVKVNR